MTIILIHTHTPLDKFDHNLVKHHIRELKELDPAVAFHPTDDIMHVVRDYYKARDMLEEVDPATIIDWMQFGDVHNSHQDYWMRKFFNLVSGGEWYDPWFNISDDNFELNKEGEVVKCTFNWMYPNDTRANSDDQGRFPPFSVRDMDDEEITGWHYLHEEDAMIEIKNNLEKYPNGLQLINGHSNTAYHIEQEEEE